MSRYETEPEGFDAVTAWFGKSWIIILSAAVALFVIVFAGKIWEYNLDENIQVCQYPNGTMRVKNNNGLYIQFFGEVATYPRNIDMFFSSKKDEGTKVDTSIEVVFADAGKGFTNHTIKLTMPVEEEKVLKVHSDFGVIGVEGIRHAVYQHLATCLKNTGPMMTASEYSMQSLAEFNKLIDEQLKEGLYEFETVEQVVVQKVDPTDAKKLHQFSGSEEEHILKTRVKLGADGKPIIIVPSPLKEYGFTVAQYSQTPATFDPDTQKQIDARREAYQLAEQAKASVQKANQETRSVIEGGKSAVAKVEATMKTEMKTKTVEAEQQVGVAEEEQKMAVNKAEQELATADQKKLESEQLFKNSEIEVEVAQATAAKMLADAMAKKAQLEQGGALADVVKLRAEQDASRRTALAKGAAQIPAPKTVILVPAKGDGGGSRDPLMQMWMMNQAGMNKPALVPSQTK